MNRRFFWIGCGLEAGLAGLALVLNTMLGQRFELYWSSSHFLIGVLATLPVFALFLLTTHATHGPLVRLKQFLDSTVRPLFQGWAIWQLLLISILAGIGEELLFRGVLQANLTRWLGLLPGLIVASFLFGACHPMTLGYLIITTLIGVYLGTLWIVAGNLLAPIVTHALYDFLALVYFLRYSKAG